MAGMRVVVVGATGNVGTSVVEVLGREAQVDTILGLARRRPGWVAPKTTWVEADITTTDLVPHFRDADVVVHLAWMFQPTHAPLVTWSNNVLGSMRVFTAAVAAGVPALVHASSVGAYSPAVDDRPVDESWPTHALPTAAYGREKSYLERALDRFESDHRGIRVVRLRPGFIFKREAAAEQRRLFAGPLLPNALVRPSLLPIVPDVPGLRFQALHSRDAAEAYRLAITTPVRGPFNLAADPVIDMRALADLLDARPVRVPVRPLRAAVAVGWHLHLIPASPMLLDLLLSLPLLDPTRACTELGWKPTRSATEAVSELLEGMREGAGMDTPPLRADAGGRLRWRELATGVGSRGGVRGDAGRGDRCSSRSLTRSEGRMGHTRNG